MVTSRRRAWSVVVGCALAGALQVATLASLRWREARARFDVTASDWRAVWAYSAYLTAVDLPGKLAGFETVRAIAPGRSIAFQAADDESVILDLAGRGDLANRVVARELARSPWPKGRVAWALAVDGINRLGGSGREDEERELALRAVTEPATASFSYFHELSVVLLARHGEHREALRSFDGLRKAIPTATVHRETLLAATSSHRALGNVEAADALEAQAVRATPHPMLTPQYKWPKAKVSADPKLRAAAALVSPEAPSAHWGPLLWAAGDVVLSYFGLPIVLFILAWRTPHPNRPTPARELVGALALHVGAVAPYLIGATFAGLGVYVVAPFVGVGSASFWLRNVVVLCVVLAALPFVEGQSLRDLGWRSSPSLTSNILIGLGCVLVLSLGRVLPAVAWARHANGWFPRLLLGSALMSLYAAAIEETLNRGYLMRALMHLTNRFWLVNLGQSVFFAAAHVVLGSAPGRMGNLVLIAAIFGWLARRSQSLWPSFVCHCAYDLVVLYATLMPNYDAFSMISWELTP